MSSPTRDLLKGALDLLGTCLECQLHDWRGQRGIRHSIATVRSIKSKARRAKEFEGKLGLTIDVFSMADGDGRSEGRG